jgi:hypothetical protein
MTNSAAEKRVLGELNMNTAVLPALAIPSNQNHQPMKTSLQKRSLRTTGLALAIALGLASGNHSAQAALVQITLGGATWVKTNASAATGWLNITGGGAGSTSGVQWVASSTDPFDPNMIFPGAYEFYADNGGLNGGYQIGFSSSGDESTYFEDTRINSGTKTAAVVSITGDGNSVTLTRVVFNNTSTTDLSGFNSATTYSDWSPTSTAVPEPGTLLPAAALVAGALLRRRRGRASRSGSGAAA